MSFSSSVSIFTFAALTMQLQQTHFPKKRIISKDSYTYLIGRSMTMWFHCCWGFNTITILESWTNSNQFQLSFLAMCFSNQWTNRCGKICTWHLDFGKRESTVYSCNCNWGSGEATVATQILSFWTRLCNWGKNLKGFLPNHIKEAADAHRFRLRKPLGGREWVAFCALLPLPVPGIRPTGVWLRDHICCHSSAVDTSKDDWTALRSHDVQDVMPLYGLWRCQGLFPCVFHQLVYCVLCFCKNVGDDVGAWEGVCAVHLENTRTKYLFFVPLGACCYLLSPPQCGQ